MLTGLGHDLVAISELADKPDLREPGVMFTERERARAGRAIEPSASFAGLFAAKEAFFKAVPAVRGCYWTDIEVVHDRHGAPRLCLHGDLHRQLEAQGVVVHVSISHCGDYASATVLAERRAVA